MAIRSKISLTNELRMAMALLEIPVSGWTCFKTGEQGKVSETGTILRYSTRTLVDIRAVGFLSGLLALLLLAIGGGGRLAALARCFLRSLGAFGLGRGLTGSRSRGLGSS